MEDALQGAVGSRLWAGLGLPPGGRALQRLASCLLLGSMGPAWAIADAPGGSAREVQPLVGDPTFLAGVEVYDPAPGRMVTRGRLTPWPESGAPVWGLAQWHSRFTLAGASSEVLPDGRVRYADAGKSLVFGAAGGTPGGVELRLDGTVEYAGQAPERGDPWPHALLAQRLLQQPALPELASVRFRLRYRLVHSEAQEGPGWDAKRHTAQFVIYVTVQNLNRESPGYGDYLWFGVNLYDRRFRSPRAFAAPDLGTAKKAGTGKFIIQPAFEQFSAVSPHDGAWIEIDSEVLPMMLAALETAWQRGYLAGSRSAADYCLGRIGLGWETTGTVDATIALEEVHLDAVRRQ